MRVSIHQPVEEACRSDSRLSVDIQLDLTQLLIDRRYEIDDERNDALLIVLLQVLIRDQETHIIRLFYIKGCVP